MNNLIRNKVILCLLDCIPKSADKIASEINESLTVIQDSLAELASKNICEEVSVDEGSRWTISQDVETFAHLVKEFLSNGVTVDEQKSQFVSSKHYLTNINHELVDFVIKRFHLDAVYQTDDEREALRRILLASPSALVHVLYTDAQVFDKMQSSHNQLDTSDSTRDRFTQILRSQFHAPLLEKLNADMKIPTYGVLYARLGIRVAKISTEVSLATLHENYVEAIAGGISFLFQAREDIVAGQPVSTNDPLTFSYQGLALMNLREFQTAIDVFDTALNAMQDSIDKAIVLNNKGLAFLRIKQYQKAIECFDGAIDFDSEGKILQIRENKQLAAEYLARATDADNLTEPTQIRFVQDHPVPFEETRLYEFKEVSGGNPVRSVTNTADEYAVAFFNGKGGRIFWGIRNSDRITVGVFLDERQKDEMRTQVSQKLWSIRPPIVDGDWDFKFHNAYDLQGQTIENLWVIELVIAPPREKNVFYTNSGDLFVKTEGGKQKLLGPQVTQFIRNFFENNAETD